MLPAETSVDWSRVDIAVPRRAPRLPGIHMAGFHQRVPTRVHITMVAHPSVTVIVDLSERDGLAYDVDGARRRGSVVAGLLPGEFRVAGEGIGECLQIRLEPAAAAAVFGSAGELGGMTAPLDDVWGRAAGRIEDRLRAAASWDERFRIAAEILARRLDARPRVDREVAHAWRRMLADRGRIRVDGLADEVGWSRKRLWSRFRSQLGIGPKRAAALMRFDHAAHLLAAGRTPADAAAESGYLSRPQCSGLQDPVGDLLSQPLCSFSPHIDTDSEISCGRRRRERCWRSGVGGRFRS